jgi:hypothetical protein
MRTTLTIEPEVARRIESEIRRTRKTLKAVINDALKVGLGISVKEESPPPFIVKAWDMGLRPGIDPNKLNQLADELETEAIIEKMRQGR